MSGLLDLSREQLDLIIPVVEAQKRQLEKDGQYWSKCYYMYIYGRGHALNEAEEAPFDGSTKILCGEFTMHVVLLS